MMATWPAQDLQQLRWL